MFKAKTLIEKGAPGTSTNCPDQLSRQFLTTASTFTCSSKNSSAEHIHVFYYAYPYIREFGCEWVREWVSICVCVSEWVSVFVWVSESITLYGSETWTINRCQANKLLAAEMNYCRRSAWKSRLEKIRNIDIRKIMKVGRNVLQTIEERRFRWYRHFRRMTSDRIPKKILEWRVMERE